MIKVLEHLAKEKANYEMGHLMEIMRR